MSTDPRGWGADNCHADAVDIRLKAPCFCGPLISALAEPFRLSSLSAEHVSIQCDYACIWRLRVPAVQVRVHALMASADFSMWPQRRPIRGTVLSILHRHQIAAMDALLGHGPSPPTSWQRRVQRWKTQFAIAAMRRLSVAVTDTAIELRCSGACMLEQPVSVEPAALSDTMGMKTLVINMDALHVAPAATLSLTLSTTSAPAVEAFTGTQPLLSLQLSGLSILCREQSASGAVTATHILRRWSMEAACHQRAARALSRAAPELRVDVHTQALVARVDAVALRTLRLFLSAVGEHARFARYRRYRPEREVRRDIKAWWRHAARCVCMHLREIRQDAPLPILCLQHFPRFRRAYKLRGQQSAAGVRLIIL